MNFLWVFLISVLTLALTQSSEHTSLPNDGVINSTLGLKDPYHDNDKGLKDLQHYALANNTFSFFDENNDNIMERSEFLSYFNTFKTDQRDNEVNKTLFLEHIVSKELLGHIASKEQRDFIGNILFDNYDRDKSGVLTDGDIDIFYKTLEWDEKGNVRRAAFLTLYNEWIDHAILNENPKGNPTRSVTIHID